MTLLLTTAFSGRKHDEEYVPVMTMVNTATLTDDKSSGGSTAVAPPVPTPAPPTPVVPTPVVPTPPPVTPPTPPPERRPEPPVVQRETPRPPEPEIRITTPKDLRADIRTEIPIKPDTAKKKDTKKVDLNPVDRVPPKQKEKAKTKTAPVTPPPVDLGKVVQRDNRKVQEDKARAEQAAAETAAQRQADARRSALANAARGASTAVQVGTGTKTSIELVGGPGGGGPAALNYDQYIVAEFTRNWILPSTLRDDSLTVKARVTIASDGRVVSASVSAKSGDAALDRSVESVLQRVKQVRGFPSGVSSENRTYTIKFKPEFNQGAG